MTVAVLRQLVEDGRLDPDKETVVLNTGEGLKTLDPLEPVVGPTHRVEPVAEVRAGGRPHRVGRRHRTGRRPRYRFCVECLFSAAFLLYLSARFEFHVRVRRAEEQKPGPPIKRGRPSHETWEHTWHRAP